MNLNSSYIDDGLILSTLVPRRMPKSAEIGPEISVADTDGTRLGGLSGLLGGSALGSALGGINAELNAERPVLTAADRGVAAAAAGAESQRQQLLRQADFLPTYF